MGPCKLFCVSRSSLLSWVGGEPGRNADYFGRESDTRHSSVVGIAVLALGMFVPGKIGQGLHANQVKLLKAVSHNLDSTEIFVLKSSMQTDARVQKVTESESKLISSRST